MVPLLSGIDLYESWAARALERGWKVELAMVTAPTSPYSLFSCGWHPPSGPA